MATNVVSVKIDGAQLVHTLGEARAELEKASGELMLEFASVQRIDAAALKAMEELVSLAETKGIKLVLHGATVDVYKVLKLVNLAPRLSFVH